MIVTQSFNFGERVFSTLIAKATGSTIAASSSLTSAGIGSRLLGDIALCSEKKPFLVSP